MSNQRYLLDPNDPAWRGSPTYYIEQNELPGSRKRYRRKWFTSTLKGRGKKARSADRKGGRHLAAFLLPLALLLNISAVAPVYAYTQQPPIFSGSSELDAAPWATKIPTFANQNGPVDPTFDHQNENLSIVVWTKQLSTPDDWSYWTLGFAYNKTGKVRINKYTSGSNTYYAVDNFTHHGYIVGPLAISAWRQQNNYTGGCPNPQPDCERGYIGSLVQQSTSANNSPGPGNILGFVLVKNPQYGAAYDGPQNYNSTLKTGVVELSCDPFDVMCKLANLWHGVTDSVSSVGRAMLRGIYDFFAPDPDVIMSHFNNLKTTFENQLGFLAYPFTFFIDLFEAPPSGSCSQSSCVRNYGSYFGTPFNYDFAVLPREFPTVFSIVQNLVRGLLSLGIITVLYKKIMNILDGDDKDV